MKKNDVALLVFIIAITLMVSYFVGRAVIGEPKSQPVQVDRVVAIQPDYPTPDPRVFNDKAIDPTVNISIGGKNANNDPFTSSNQSQ